MHNAISDSVEIPRAPVLKLSGLALLGRPGLFRPVFAPLILLVIVALGWLIAEFVVYRGVALSEQSALHLGCMFAAVTLGALSATVVFKSGGFDLSAGPILYLTLTISAWGVKEDVAVICAFGDNLPGAEEKWQRNQAELDAKKAGRGWESQGAFYHDVARNSRYLERLQYIRKSGASYTPYSPALAVVLAMGVALALGVLNGAMVRWLPIPSLCATLGTSVVALSCAQYASNSSLIRPAANQIPYWLGLPQPGHVCLAMAAATVVGLSLWFGWLPTRGAAAIGEWAPPHNEAGEGSTMTVYSLAGLLAGLAGICLFPYLTAGGAADGVGWQLRFVVAAGLGGAMLTLRRGLMWGTLIGAAVIASIEFGGFQFGLLGPVRDVLIVALFAAVLVLDRLSAVAPTPPAT